MKYYIIAGEASGDLHGSNLIKALKEKDAQANFRIWGGDKMEAAGAQLVKHYKDLAFMGFVEVVKNLRTILGNIRFCKQDITSFQPDVLILIDYPGFNLRIAKWAKKQNIKIFYYISPQLWAWHASRVKQIKANIDRMFVIIPFEKKWYADRGVEVDYVGHPLKDVIDNYKVDTNFKYANTTKKVIALLPGSRQQEIKRVLPKMLEVANDYPEYKFVIAKAKHLPWELYQNIIENTLDSSIDFVDDETYNLLSVAHAALVTSGTATLETALFKIPQVVCYSGNPISFQIAKRLVDVPYISLVNLIAERKLVDELIQDELNKVNLQNALDQILDGNSRSDLMDAYEVLSKRLGEKGASKMAAKLMHERLKN
ncbi:MAG: lipid-A-disaccharide synthase [Bacteroidota bacterium]